MFSHIIHCGTRYKLIYGICVEGLTVFRLFKLIHNSFNTLTDKIKLVYLIKKIHLIVQLLFLCFTLDVNCVISRSNNFL